MEFFATADIRTNATLLQRNLTIASLPNWCASISKVLENHGDRGTIYCIWGEFIIHREVIRDGIRFTLPGCPNALQWTVTVEDSAPSGRALVHCSINRTQHAADFIESVRQFVADCKSGLEHGIAQGSAHRTAPGECMPWYG